MKIYLPLHVQQYFKDVIGIKMRKSEEHIELDIDLESPAVLIDLFYRGAEYGADETIKIAKENLQKSRVLNNFRLN